MKTMLAILAAVLIHAAPVAAQEHAPLLEQCKADRALWYSLEQENEYRKAYLKDGPKNATEFAQLPIKTIKFRIKEMSDCWSVSSQQDDQYVKAAEFYDMVFRDRCLSFIYRHHLMGQLLSEDERGMR
jgi:hypothetical protein